MGVVKSNRDETFLLPQVHLGKGDTGVYLIYKTHQPRLCGEVLMPKFLGMSSMGRFELPISSALGLLEREEGIIKGNAPGIWAMLKDIMGKS